MSESDKGDGPGMRPFRLGVIGSRGIGSVQGGIEYFCTHFYSKLRPYGFETTIFVRLPVKLYELPAGIATYLVLIPRLRAIETIFHSFASILLARAFGIRTIHVHGIGPCLVLPLAAALGLRAIVRHLGADYRRTKWGTFARTSLRLGERFAARYAEAIVCLHQHIANDFSLATGRTHLVYVVPNGIDASPPPSEIGENNQLGLVNKRYILAVGRLVPEKNFHLLLSAFLRATLPSDVKLVLAGAVDYGGSYGRALLNACANQERVITPGAVYGSQLHSLYQNAGLFVLPSSHEGMSFALLKAGVLGLNIIASDIPGNSAVCSEFARLVPVDSAEALREAIEVEWNRERPIAEIEREISICKSRYDWDAVVQQMVPILSPPASSRLGGT